jgi:hypothetical protein
VCVCVCVWEKKGKGGGREGAASTEAGEPRPHPTPAPFLRRVSSALSREVEASTHLLDALELCERLVQQVDAVGNEHVAKVHVVAGAAAMGGSKGHPHLAARERGVGVGRASKRAESEVGEGEHLETCVRAPSRRGPYP